MSHPLRCICSLALLMALLAGCQLSTMPAVGMTPTPPDAAVSPETTKTITTEHGTFEIPLNPERVIVMENRRDLETAVALDLPLVAVGIWGGAADPSDVAAPFVPVDLTGVEILNTEQPNIETILALDPDLIISREFYLGESFLEGALTSAAPILPVASRGPWRPDLEQAAAWLEREEALDEVLVEYAALRDEVAQRHAEALASAQVAIVEWYGPDANFYAGGLDDFQLQANTLGELGGQLIPFQQGRDYFAEPFSIEKVGELAAADAILLVGPASEGSLEELRSMELWQTLPAVQAGRVVVTDTRTNQGSVYAAMEALRLLDELYSTLE